MKNAFKHEHTPKRPLSQEQVPPRLPLSETWRMPIWRRSREDSLRRSSILNII